MSLLKEMKKRNNAGNPLSVVVQKPDGGPEPSSLPVMDEAAGPLPDRDGGLKARLAELILMSENSKGMTPDQVKAISDEGDLIIDQLPPETVKRIFA
ncbi:MAG: hypothetical protein WA081_09820 [Desulfosalsimonadaceae bacterium]